MIKGASMVKRKMWATVRSNVVVVASRIMKHSQAKCFSPKCGVPTYLPSCHSSKFVFPLTVYFNMREPNSLFVITKNILNCSISWKGCLKWNIYFHLCDIKLTVYFISTDTIFYTNLARTFWTVQLLTN